MPAFDCLLRTNWAGCLFTFVSVYSHQLECPKCLQPSDVKASMLTCSDDTVSQLFAPFPLCLMPPSEATGSTIFSPAGLSEQRHKWGSKALPALLALMAGCQGEHCLPHLQQEPEDPSASANKEQDYTAYRTLAMTPVLPPCS